MSRLPLSLPYAAYEELGERPHVMVDGAARPGSVLTLSHWPQSPTPSTLARDLSTEIVLDLQSRTRLLEPAVSPRPGTEPTDGFSGCGRRGHERSGGDV